MTRDPGHEPLQGFADGELSVDDATRFRLHLGDCVLCQDELRDALQLQAIASTSGRPAPQQASAPRPFRPAWSQRRALSLASAGLAVAAVMTFAVVSARGPRKATERPLALALAAHRSQEVRLTSELFAPHRPYDVRRSVGAVAEDVPLSLLAELEARGDWRGLASAHLLRGELDAARRAFEKAAPSPDQKSDLAAARLLAGAVEEALVLTGAALEADPHHAAAHWNRGLALQELGLSAAAANEFRTLAAQGEPGWGAEAQSRADFLSREVAQAGERYRALARAGAAMVFSRTPMDLSLVPAAPSQARTWFYFALWSARSADEAQALLPLAFELDRAFGSERLVPQVRAALARFQAGHPAGAGVSGHAPPFTSSVGGTPESRRLLRLQQLPGGPSTSPPATLGVNGAGSALANTYRQVIAGYLRSLAATGWGPTPPAEIEPLGPAATGAFLRNVLRTRDPALLLGALPLLHQLPAQLEAYQAAAKALADPWFLLNADIERARADFANGRRDQGHARLSRVLSACTAEHAPLRCQQAHELSAAQSVDEYRPAAAHREAVAGLKLALEQGDIPAAERLMKLAGDSARLMNRFALTHAYLQEYALREPGRCRPQLQLHESLATLRLYALDPARARSELDSTPFCEEAPSAVTAFVLADLTRMDPRPGDLPRLLALLDRLRAAGGVYPAVLDHIQGRAQVEGDRAAGALLLRRSIEGADQAQASDSEAARARAYSFQVLRMMAAVDGRWGQVFGLLSEERRAPVADRCALALEVEDERLAAVATGPGGELRGLVSRRSSPEIEVGSLVPEPVLALLRPCAQVAVYAGWPLHGRAHLLPDDLPWAFREGARARPAPDGPSTELIVHDVATPASLGLPRLSAWSDGEASGRHLSGAAATPSRVLTEMVHAQLIELHVHGDLDPALEDASVLALAPDESGKWALSAEDVRGARLEGAPVVVLGACRAAQVSAWLHEPWSLPRAFIQAGARAVIASPADLPDAEARRFLDGVLQRLRAGEAAAAAVAHERVRWLSTRQGGGWVSDVLVFE